jgi:hypothetical protein
MYIYKVSEKKQTCIYIYIIYVDTDASERSFVIEIGLLFHRKEKEKVGYQSNDGEDDEREENWEKE